VFNEPKPNKIEGWACIMQRGTEYEVAMAKNYLSNLKIPSNILSKRDTAYNFIIGNMSPVFLYVPEEYEQRARKALAEWDDESGENVE